MAIYGADGVQKELHELGLAESARLIAARKTSPVELTSAILDRME